MDVTDLNINAVSSNCNIGLANFKHITSFLTAKTGLTLLSEAGLVKTIILFMIIFLQRLTNS